MPFMIRVNNSEGNEFLSWLEKNGLIETTRPENARNVQEIMSVFLTETAQKPYPY